MSYSSCTSTYNSNFSSRARRRTPHYIAHLLFYWYPCGIIISARKYEVLRIDSTPRTDSRTRTATLLLLYYEEVYLIPPALCTCAAVPCSHRRNGRLKQCKAARVVYYYCVYRITSQIQAMNILGTQYSSTCCTLCTPDCRTATRIVYTSFLFQVKSHTSSQRTQAELLDLFIIRCLFYSYSYILYTKYSVRSLVLLFSTRIGIMLYSSTAFCCFGTSTCTQQQLYPTSDRVIEHGVSAPAHDTRMIRIISYTAVLVYHVILYDLAV